MNQATFFATITDTTPGTVTDLPAPTSDDPASVGLTETPATSGNTVAGFSRLPILRKSRPEPSRHVSGASQRTPSGGDGDGRGGGAAVPFLLDGLHGAQVADTAAAVGRRGCCPRYLPLGYFPVRMPARRNTATWT